jgi:hypothetical protein
MKEISIDWCPTKKMVADFMTKPTREFVQRVERLHHG